MGNNVLRLWIADSWKTVEGISKVPFDEDEIIRFDPAPGDDLQAKLELALASPGSIWVRVNDGEEYLYSGGAGPFHLMPESIPTVR